MNLFSFINFMVCVCAHMDMEAQRTTLLVILQELSTLTFEAGSHLLELSEVRADWPVNSRDCFSLSPSTGITSTHGHTQLYIWVPGLELTFTKSAISNPSPLTVYTGNLLSSWSGV